MLLYFSSVKSDALFSYQPPFNLLAFLILFPLSFVLTPRSLHTVNVFMIKVTVSLVLISMNGLILTYYVFLQSFPFLVLIGVYERYLRKGQKLREQSSDAANHLYNRLSRQMKNMPILEHIVGSASMDVYEAIFETDLSGGYNIFEDSDDEGRERDPFHAIRERSRSRMRGEDVFGSRARTVSRDSREAPSINVSRPSTSRASSPDPGRRPSSLSRNTQTPSSQLRSRRDITASGSGVSPSGSPRPRRVALPQIQPANSGEILSAAPKSPLVAFFGGGRREHSSSQVDRAAAVAATAEAGIKRIEALAEDIKKLPVNKLKDEMKELQVSCLVCMSLSMNMALISAGSQLHLSGPTSKDRKPVVDVDQGDEKRDWKPFVNPA